MDMKTKRVPDPIFWAVGLCFWMVQMESCAPNHPKAIQTMAAATQSIDWKQFWWPTGISFWYWMFHDVLSFISHLRTSVVFQMQRCCREATAKACPPSWHSDSYIHFSPLQCYLMIDVRRRCIFQPSSFIFQNLSAPRRRGRPKQIWGSEVYRMAVEIVAGFDMFGDLLRAPLSGARKFAHFVFCRQVNNAIAFPGPCVTVHEANEWKKMFHDGNGWLYPSERRLRHFGV